MRRFLMFLLLKPALNRGGTYSRAALIRVNTANFYDHFVTVNKSQKGGTQLLQGLLWFAEKTIEQTTEQWTLALKTIELRDTKVQW